MKILVIGSGGREHALAWKAAQSENVDCVFVAPGNAGTDSEAGIRNIDIAATDIDGLIGFARDNDIHLTIVGPEQPLSKGLVDAFEDAGLRCFGPTRGAAQLESSKAFCKDFMQRHAIPTAAYATFSEIDPAIEYLATASMPIVIKADGLAAGKGVIIAENLDQATATVRDMLSGNAFGEAGHRVVIEEFLAGEEASFICLCADDKFVALASSQDHKAVGDGDTGDNTGGMGAYSPSPLVTETMHQRIVDEVIRPTLDGMRAEGHPFTGFLYAGLMIGADDSIRVLEFNVRFGDPETQPVMMRLKSDLVSLCDAALDGSLDDCQVDWDQRAALGVVMAAGGYPHSYDKGARIDGLDEVTGAKVFHAGTALSNDAVVTAGGRVLCVCALGETVTEAQQQAYAATRGIHFDDCFYRSDIGYRAVGREQHSD